MTERKTIEEYEVLARRLADDRDGARDAAARMATENKVLRQELVPALERVIDLLGTTVLADGELRSIRDDATTLVEDARWYRVIVRVLSCRDLTEVPTILPREPLPWVVSRILGLMNAAELAKNPTPKLKPKRYRPKKKQRRR